MSRARNLMKKISGIDKEEKIHLEALWTLLLGLEEALENEDYERAEDCVLASEDYLNELEELVKKHIDFYEPIEAYKLGREFFCYFVILTFFKTKLNHESLISKKDLMTAQNFLSSITRIFLGEDIEEDKKDD